MSRDIVPCYCSGWESRLGSRMGLGAGRAVDRNDLSRPNDYDVTGTKRTNRHLLDQ